MGLLAKIQPNSARKKPTKFQRLWRKTERLAQQNNRLRAELIKLVALANNKLRPLEREVAEAQRDTVLRLVQFQRYRSLTQWQRQELQAWVDELMVPLIEFDLFDQALKNEIALSIAFMYGIELDEESALNADEQVQAYFQQLQDKDIERHAQSAQADKDAYAQYVNDQVERLIKQKFGRAQHKQNQTVDLFQAELDEAEQGRQVQIEAFRRQETERLWAEQEEIEARMESGFEEAFFGGDDHWRGNNWYDEEFPSDLPPPKFDSKIFHRLFRKAANALHPDKETDPSKRVEKQNLMGRLLRARKQGDFLAIFKLYQQYIGDDVELNIEDEKQLYKVLENNIAVLLDEKDEIINQSPTHALVYEHLYARTQKARARKLTQFLADIEQDKQDQKTLLASLKTLSALKPMLSERYDSHKWGFSVDW